MSEEENEFGSLKYARERMADANYAWERDRDENARTLALLSIANSMVVIAEQVKTLNKRLDSMTDGDPYFGLRVYATQ